jgi:hypothetical protein
MGSVAIGDKGSFIDAGLPDAPDPRGQGQQPPGDADVHLGGVRPPWRSTSSWPLRVSLTDSIHCRIPAQGSEAPRLFLAVGEGHQHLDGGVGIPVPALPVPTVSVSAGGRPDPTRPGAQLGLGNTHSSGRHGGSRLRIPPQAHLATARDCSRLPRQPPALRKKILRFEVTLDWVCCTYAIEAVVTTQSC